MIITSGILPEMQNKTGIWIVNIHGEPGSGSGYEISVLRNDYQVGKYSYGWDGEDIKIIISSNTSHGTLPKMVWDKLISLSQEVAEEMNSLGRFR